MVVFSDYFTYDPTSPTFLTHAYDKSPTYRKGMPAGSIKRRRGHITVSSPFGIHQSSRVIWALHHNNEMPPDDICICTKNGNVSDLRIENLIPLTMSQRRHYLNLIDGKASVELRGKRFHARIETPSERRFIGSYATRDEAVEAHRKAAMAIVLGMPEI